MELFNENLKKKLKLPLYFEDNIFSPHDCDMLKIILIEEGSTILYINNKSFVITAPALLCLNEKESIRVHKVEGFVAHCLYFSPSIVNIDLNIKNIYLDTDYLPGTTKLDHFYFLPFLDRSKLNFGQIDIGLITMKKISALFNDLKVQIINYEDRFWPCRNRSFLIEILFLIQHCYSKKEIGNTNLTLTTVDISEIILYIHLHYDRKLTIEELTGEFHTNRNSLNKRFKKETGLSVFEYIIGLRIKVACMLLRDTHLPIAEIVERVGFVDISYWGRAFKKITGLTPSNFRKAFSLDSML